MRAAHNTRIYLRSLELIDFVARVLRALPPGYGFLADQLRRAAAEDGVPRAEMRTRASTGTRGRLNYLEGCGRNGPAERRRFFSIASGSAHEVAGTLDVMHRFGVLGTADRSVGHDLCDHLVAMLRRFR